MKREIKFRVWNKTYCEMFYPEKFLKNGDYIEKFYITLDGKLRGDFKHCGDVDCSEDYMIMQYTGLLDKNGKEIYEGDIIRYDNHETPVLIRWTTAEMDYHPGWIVNDLFTQCGSHEVIGNIFETPLKLQR